jgi:iron complex outermembrane receptor protein
MNRKIAIAMFPLFTIPNYASAFGAAENLSSVDSVPSVSAVDSIRGTVTEGGSLQEIVVSGNSSKKDIQMRSALNTVGAGQTFIEKNFSGSLMKTLSRLPGVKSMNVGSGESKPIIRGLGFNRVVVTENGIKHEGQQWGDDHGLETDQFLVESAEVVKGPAALNYGSDAIGGVINLQSDALPDRRFAGGAKIFARSNNMSVGAAAGIRGRSGRFWYKANATAVDYGDYRVPIDSIQYYSYYIKLKDNLLRNTAGREYDGSILLGYADDRLKSYIRLSDVNSKSGFFANAHGIEVRLSQIDYDKSRRDIDLPCHKSNHLSLSSRTEWKWSGGTVEGDLSYQNNRQEELSEPISHGYMPIPPDSLERRFDKDTFSGNVNVRMRLGSHTLRVGLSGQYQQNSRGGWGFILPDFEQLTYGTYVSDRFIVNDGLVLSAGVRCDFGHVDVHSYRDWYATPADSGGEEYLERSSELNRSFSSFTFSFGLNKSFGSWIVKANAGKSFRMPTAKELGADGVNYSIFRYERGNAALNPEQSYQIDAGIVCETSSFDVEVTPFVNYFPNYIYLNPKSDFVEGLQLYNYTQSKVLRWGFEVEATYRFLRHFEASLGGEYIYARQLSGEKKGYTLPFSTPWSARFGLKYKFLSPADTYVGDVLAEWLVVGRQGEVVPPEEPTAGYQLLNVSLSRVFRFGKNSLRATLNCENLLGKRYFDHTGYYRLIGVPEPGRNISIMLGWDF